MANANRSVFSEALRNDLKAFGDELFEGRAPSEQLDALLHKLMTLPPDTISRAASEVRHLAKLHHEQYLKPPFFSRTRRGPTHKELLLSCRGLEKLFMFHGDGRLREIALNRVIDPPASAWFFSAITYRLNDWVPEVRAAGMACAERLFPKTDPEIVARAAMSLLDRKRFWRRGSSEFQPIETAIVRPDVLKWIVALLRDTKTGRAGAILRHLFRFPQIDQHLYLLSADAFLPSVRAVALGSLIDGEVRWLGDISERRWIDKSMGRFRDIPATASRPIVRDKPLAELVEQSGVDRSALVRRLASAALLRHHTELAGMETLIARLSNDSSRSIRDRMAFLAGLRRTPS